MASRSLVIVALVAWTGCAKITQLEREPLLAVSLRATHHQYVDAVTLMAEVTGRAPGTTSYEWEVRGPGSFEMFTQGPHSSSGRYLPPRGTEETITAIVVVTVRRGEVEATSFVTLTVPPRSWIVVLKQSEAGLP